MCIGCGLPRDESFDPRAEDHYEVAVIQCHACAARDRKSYNRNVNRDSGSTPPFGEYLVVTGLDDEYEMTEGR